MGIANIINTSTSGGGGGEIIRELVNSSDGQGLYFSNTGYIHLANNAAAEFGTSDFSIEFILNQTGEVGSSGGSIYQSATTIYNKFSIENHVQSNVVKLIFFNAVGAAAQYDLPYNMASDYNEPTHYVVSCDRSGNAVLYRNGTEVASVSIATSASINLGDGVSSTAMIGNSGSGYTFLGGLYRFRTWNKALSHDEVDTCFQRADVPFADQYGSQTSKILNGTNWTGASGTTPPNSWTVGSGQVPNFTIDSSSGSGNEPALKFQRGANNMPFFFQTFTAEIGKKYRVAYRIKNIDAIHVRVGIGSSAVGTQYNVSDYTSTDWVDYADTFTATTTTFSVYVQANTVTGTQGGYIDSVVVEKVGVLTDHDLAFANPTQSAMCQDRAGNSDGTMGGTIQQTQKIPQLNATAIAVSAATSRTPADGAIVADKAGIGTGSPGRLLELSNATNPALRINNGNSTADIGVASSAGALLTGAGDDDLVIARNGAYGIAIGTNGTTRMAISSAGQVEVASGNAHISSATQSSLGFGNISTNTYAKVEYDDTNGNFNINNTRAYPLRFLTTDALRMSVSSAGNVAIGSSAASEKLHLMADGSVGTRIERASSDGNSGVLDFYKTRGTLGSKSIVGTADTVGALRVYGYDGSNYIQGGELAFKTNGTCGVNDMPTQFVVSTTADGASSPTERMTITPAGVVQIGPDGVQGGALLSVRRNGDAFNFGHINGAGYGSNLGCSNTSGYPHLALMCEAGTNNNTFKTRGLKGNVIYSTATGELRFAQITNANADNQSTTDRITLDANGSAAFTGEISCTGLTISNQTNTTVGTRTSSKFDHYEEGTFTASLTATTPPTSVPTATGNYIRIGKLCYIQIRFNNVDTSGASGAMQVTGLPFTSANTNDSNVANQLLGQFYNLPWLPSNPKITRNDNKVTFVSQNNGGAWSAYNISANANVYLHIAGTYVV